MKITIKQLQRTIDKYNIGRKRTAKKFTEAQLQRIADEINRIIQEELKKVLL